ncbi:hypothetical protein GALL_450300 [mine drainage metagenome]|uniref:Uncharacterized protein n=1 Tax=mine drainage metagenome TaxID=410659 RepID=A0A1J5Q0G3_9ZZZZ
MPGVPGEHRVEQAHRALVRNARGDPVAVQRLAPQGGDVQHGATLTASVWPGR